MIHALLRSVFFALFFSLSFCGFSSFFVSPMSFRQWEVKMNISVVKGMNDLGRKPWCTLLYELVFGEWVHRREGSAGLGDCCMFGGGLLK